MQYVLNVVILSPDELEGSEIRLGTLTVNMTESMVTEESIPTIPQEPIMIATTQPTKTSTPSITTEVPTIAFYDRYDESNGGYNTRKLV